MTAGVFLCLPVVSALLSVYALAGWIPTTLLVAISAGLGWRFWPMARKRWQASAEEVQRRDTRPPVLLLRSFQDDLIELRPPWFRRGRSYGFEEIITGQLWCRGPVIAIGRPGELLPPIGAARDYFSDDDWQSQAERMARESQTIAMIVGATEGLAWEIRRIHDWQLLPKLILIFPPVPPRESTNRWETFCAFVRDREEFQSFTSVHATKLLFVAFTRDRHPIMITVGERREVQAYQLALAAAVQITEQAARHADPGVEADAG